MAEVTRAVVIALATAAARFSIIENTHTRIKETIDSRLGTIIGSAICNFNDRTLLNFIRTKDPKLNPYNGLNFRAWSY
jgi:lipoprotein signal peptidase